MSQRFNEFFLGERYRTISVKHSFDKYHQVAQDKGWSSKYSREFEIDELGDNIILRFPFSGKMGEFRKEAWIYADRGVVPLSRESSGENSQIRAHIARNFVSRMFSQFFAGGSFLVVLLFYAKAACLLTVSLTTFNEVFGVLLTVSFFLFLVILMVRSDGQGFSATADDLEHLLTNFLELANLELETR